MKNTSKKDPRKYSVEEFKELDLELVEVNFGQDWETNPEEEIKARYRPKKVMKAECSFCKKNKQVYSIEGLVYNKEKEIRNQINYQTFYLLCKSCLIAKKISDQNGNI